MLPNTEQRAEDMQEETDDLTQELYDSEGDWLEFFKELGHDPDYEGIVKELRLSVRCNDTVALNGLSRSYREWCEKQASEIVSERYKRI